MARLTVQGYFDILKDTLIGDWLPAWQLKRSTKQVAHPKFYFFDPGVARALSNRLPYPPLPEELGPLVETYLLHELRAYLAYSERHYPIYFWASHQGVEVDFIIETQKGFVAIEVKGSKQWQRHYNKGLLRLREEFGAATIRCLGVYLGEQIAQYDPVTVFPLTDFLRALWDETIIQ